MKILMKAAIITILGQAAFAGAAQAQAARPIAVDINVGELSAVSGEIASAVAAGDNCKAEEMLSGLYSGGFKAEKAAPVYADKCNCHTAAPVPAAEAGAPAANVPAVVTEEPSTLTPEERILVYQISTANIEKERIEKKKAEDADKEQEKIGSMKRSKWGAIIMGAALLLLFLL